jgi:bifunctional pyridoxal-dependent enzyme with beta-cystathionase and maltose regulon repressor activities
MMTATTKTFNIAGSHIGNVIIADPVLRDLCQHDERDGHLAQQLRHAHGDRRLFARRCGLG